MPPHHGLLFRISPEPSVKAGVEATVLMLKDLMEQVERFGPNDSG